MTICPICRQCHENTECPAGTTVTGASWLSPPKPARIPHTCPTCHGQKTVSRPPWTAGDASEWLAYDTAMYPCPTCDATGIVWESVP